MKTTRVIDYEELEKTKKGYFALHKKSYKDVIEILNDVETEQIKGWIPFENEVDDGVYDVFLIRNPIVDSDDEQLIRQARIEYRKGECSSILCDYSKCINDAETYLRIKKNPDIEIFALLTLANAKRIKQIIDNLPKGIGRPKKAQDEIDERTLDGLNYSMIYNYLAGYEIDFLNTKRIEEDLKEWLDRQGPLEEEKNGIPELSVRNFDLGILYRINNYLKWNRNLTIEEAGKSLQLPYETIDRAKICYARMAIRAKLPHLAKQYIDFVEISQFKTELTIKKLALAREELKYSSQSDSFTNKEVSKLVKPKLDNTPHECPIIFARPGYRKTYKYK